MKNPDVTFYYFEFFGLDAGRVPEKAFDYFFGRWVRMLHAASLPKRNFTLPSCFQLSDSERHAVSKYSLKTRHFIGNTSMDPQLSMIMANLAQVEDGHIVVDPFVGTGCQALFWKL